MIRSTGPAADEMTRAQDLPQLDASSLVDGERLESEVKAMYRHVAREESSALHFEVGRELAEHLGYPPDLLDAIPAEAVASFAGVGYHLDLAELQPGESVLDLGSGSGTDVFGAAVQVGPSGRVVGVDITDEQLAKAARLRERDGFRQIELVEAQHRGAAVRGRELRRGDLERRHQPVGAEGPRLRRGRARTPARCVVGQPSRD
jgi:protein-L-isoaspartate O-methyltransferase